MTEPDHKQLYRAIGNLEGKVDQLLFESKERNGRYVEVSQRVKALEKAKNVQIGRESALVLFVAALGWPTIKSWFGF